RAGGDVAAPFIGPPGCPGQPPRPGSIHEYPVAAVVIWRGVIESADDDVPLSSGPCQVSLQIGVERAVLTDHARAGLCRDLCDASAVPNRRQAAVRAPQPDVSLLAHQFTRPSSG